MTSLVAAHRIIKRYGDQPGVIRRTLERLGAPPTAGLVNALNNVTITAAPGEVVGIVGESGCGKSTLGRILAGLELPSEGAVEYRGRSLATLKGRERRNAKLKVQMVFQDPWASLNPRMRVRDIIGEAPLLHGLTTRRETNDFVRGLLDQVGLARDFMDRLPHELSGGQRQRVGIARALAVSPEVLICDEAVSALDVSVQAQILALFRKLRRDLGLTYFFISHDLGVIRNLSDRIVVMYLGRVVEEGPAEEIYASPSHPYTAALVANAPRLQSGRRVYATVRGELPSPLNPPPGCHFHPRCPHSFDRCRLEAPRLRAGVRAIQVACHLFDE